jgi:hypothetical protein
LCVIIENQNGVEFAMGERWDNFKNGVKEMLGVQGKENSFSYVSPINEAITKDTKIIRVDNDPRFQNNKNAQEMLKYSRSFAGEESPKTVEGALKQAKEAKTPMAALEEVGHAPKSIYLTGDKPRTEFKPTIRGEISPELKEEAKAIGAKINSKGVPAPELTDQQRQAQATRKAANEAKNKSSAER